jgi:hypothetical protein
MKPGKMLQNGFTVFNYLFFGKFSLTSSPAQQEYFTVPYCFIDKNRGYYTIYV